nr:immunoglobulin heavy chain junction region [Mus musculus]MBK4189553.1 immunoglobulin heavy chain junction region [Mus musculus]MBK4189554.1 immunoglobulin heavy chain junction region [Mus musculus]MBK4189555.1 immunoglobulin heavy chain junction region [Mus musculus]MBK4189556.1 immunoglobulin heavy chain junction region [Mus musculus]
CARKRGYGYDGALFDYW